MKVRLIDSVVELPDDVARDLINSGAAVPLDEVRAAVVIPPRNAARTHHRHLLRKRA
jgi:hypothetical protein